MEQSNFNEITLPHGCSPVNLLHIFRTCFLKNTSGWLLLDYPIRFRQYFDLDFRKGFMLNNSGMISAKIRQNLKIAEIGRSLVAR